MEHDMLPAAADRGFAIGKGDFVVPNDFDATFDDETLDAFEADINSPT